MRNFNEIKKDILETEISISVFKSEIAERQRELSKMYHKLDDLNEDLNTFSSKEIGVTDHAIVRYLEKVLGIIDMEEVMNAIISPELQRQIHALGGNGTYILNGKKLNIKDYKLVTILD